MAVFLVVPLVGPLLVAGLVLLLEGWPEAGRWLTAAGLALLPGVGLALLWRLWRDPTRLVLEVAGWPVPLLGITLTGDALGALLLLLGGLALLAAHLLHLALPDASHSSARLPLLLFMAAALTGVATAGDLLTLHLWLDGLVLAAFGLLIERGRQPALRSGLAFGLLHLGSSLTGLLACGLLFGLAGSLNLAHLSATLLNLPAPGLGTALVLLLLLSYATRAALFPLGFWLGSGLAVAPLALLVALGGLLPLGGLAALYRVLPLLLHTTLPTLGPLLQTLALLTLLLGAVGALAQTNLRGLLACLTLAHSGLLLLALGLTSPVGLAGGLFWLAQQGLALLALWVLASLTEYASDTAALPQMSGLVRREPVLVLLWLGAGGAWLGLLPLGGLAAWVLLLRVLVLQQAWLGLAAALLSWLLLLLSLARLGRLFCQPAPASAPPSQPIAPVLLLPGALLVALLLFAAWDAATVQAISDYAAYQLFDTAGYRADVLRSSGPQSPDLPFLPALPPEAGEG